MLREETFHLSLTGENSHKVFIPRGQGSIAIGTKELSEGKYDVWLNDGEPINWNAFNGLYTFHSQQNTEQYPYGDFPRWFYYSGNDKGFIEWSHKRYIERFTWFTYEDASIDLTQANIYTFSLHVNSGQIELSIGRKTRELSLSGSIENIAIKKCDSLPGLNFTLRNGSDEAESYSLPTYKLLKQAPSVNVDVPPLGKPFDCKSLLQFTSLESLHLHGSLINLEALAELKNLKILALRYVPDLSGMPSLLSFPKLTSFIGYNIEETVGKTLKKEFKNSNIAQLRKKIWFTTEYGIPFDGWEAKNAKVATRAYKACLKEIKKAKNESEAREAIVTFVQVINTLPNIETIEREDAGTAVMQLVESSALGISEETGLEWFDEVRDF